MDVAVGGTNGWFPDGVGNKPWVDSSPTAPFDVSSPSRKLSRLCRASKTDAAPLLPFCLALSQFYNATDKWYKTWPDEPKERGMAIKNFKMWQKC